MDSNFELAPLSQNNDIINDLSKYENELKKKMGKDVVLIAYTKEAKA